MSSRNTGWKNVHVECAGSGCGYVGHMTADELKERAATDEVDLCCPVCGMIHLSSEEIEELKERKISESPRYLEIKHQAEAATGR